MTLWRASSAEKAKARAGTDASAYAAVITDGPSTVLGLVQSYEFVDEPGDGAEVSSLMRHSALGPREYLEAFFDTGTGTSQQCERTRRPSTGHAGSFGPKPGWVHPRSACEHRPAGVSYGGTGGNSR